jgi:hypothetical protein
MVMKGKAIRFIGGKYDTKKGWIDTDREAGENTIPVVVDLGKKGERETYVYKENPPMPRQSSSSAPIWIRL